MSDFYLQRTSSKDKQQASLLLQRHLQRPQLGDRQQDNDKILNDTRNGTSIYDGQQIDTFPMFVQIPDGTDWQALASRSNQEAKGVDEDQEDKDLYVATELLVGEYTQIEEEDRDFCCRLNDDV